LFRQSVVLSIVDFKCHYAIVIWIPALRPHQGIVVIDLRVKALSKLASTDRHINAAVWRREANDSLPECHACTVMQNHCH